MTIADVYEELTTERQIEVEGWIGGISPNVVVKDNGQKLVFAIGVTDGTGGAMVHVDADLLVEALRGLVFKGEWPEKDTLAAILRGKMMKASGPGRVGPRGLEVQATEVSFPVQAGIEVAQTADSDTPAP